MNLRRLREHVQMYGVQETAGKICELVRSRKIPTDSFSLRSTWEAFVGPVDETLSRAMDAGGMMTYRALGVQEAVSSMAFSQVTQTVILNRVQAAYDATPGIADQLVTPFQSSLRTERVAGFSAMDGPRDVGEGREYPQAEMTDRAVQAPEPPKRGREVDITDEAIRFDQTGQMLVRAQMIGAKMRMDREKNVVSSVQDLTNYKCFYPLVAGTPTQTDLFRSSAGTDGWYNKMITKKTSNALVSYKQIEAAWLLFKAMKDEAGDPILIQPRVVLVPMDLRGTAVQALNANWQIALTDSNVVYTQTPNLAPRIVGGAVTPLDSVFMNDSSTWYIGDPQSQFLEQVIIPPETREIPPDPTRDIVARYITRRKSRVIAVDDKFWVQSISGS